MDATANRDTTTEIDGDEHAYIRRSDRPVWSDGDHVVRVVDLFSGVGGLTLGAFEAARSLGFAAECAWAVDFDEAAVACHAANFGERAEHADLSDVFDPHFDNRLTARERRVRRDVGEVDVLLGGPPCQGHSDLNNYSRRDDPKNGLYGTMARAARVLRPRHVVVENVVGAAHDRGGVVQATVEALERLGYTVTVGLVDALGLGVPQRRRRLLVVGSSGQPLDFESLYDADGEPRDLRWAIDDLVDHPAATPFDTPSTPSADNQRRIAHLFEHDLFDLPDAQRPACHRDKPHTYRSVYGRLRWDEPAQTITSGFYSTCMGRYVHPTRPRTLTAHEAARLQFFPDFFDFGPCRRRTTLARVIGNAVPPKIGFAVVRQLLWGESMESPLHPRGERVRERGGNRHSAPVLREPLTPALSPGSGSKSEAT